MNKKCAYCKRPADGAMLCMGKTMAHSDCVIQKLNELLDPDWEEGDKRKPDKIVAIIDPDAELPDIREPGAFYTVCVRTQESMLKAGWRKVISPSTPG